MSAARAAAAHYRGVPLPWVAVVADAGGLAPLAELPVRRLLVAPPGRGRGLALFATAGGELPPTACRGEVGVVFEGTLVNRHELAAELGVADELASPELVALAYVRWGEAMATRLRGPLALVLWDGREQRLLASRDRMGICPLVYAEVGGEIVLSSSPDLVRRHPRVPRDLHRAKFAELLSLHIFDVQETSYRAIRRLAPGHRWVRDATNDRHEMNWELSHVGQLPGTLDEHLERFEALLDQAVARAVAPGDLGILLSGGLDSVSIAALAAERCRAEGIEVPRALSLVFPDEESNEEERQRGVAAELGLPLLIRGFHEASGGEGRALVAGIEASRKFPTPALTLWRPAYLRLLAEGNSAGSRVILTGHGGDEWLGVSIYLAADYLRRLELGKLLRLYRIRRRSFNLNLLRSLRNVFWRFGARPVLVGATLRLLGGAADGVVRSRKLRHLRQAQPSWVAPDPALRRELAERAERYLPEPPLGDFYLAANRNSFAHPIATLEYEEIYEVGRQVGVTFASPFLDEDLVDFLLGVPPEILHAGDRTKGLVRSSLGRRFPHLGFDRQKKVAATSFFRELVHGQMDAAIDHLGGLSALQALGVVDEAGWRSYTARTATRSPDLEMARIWFACSMESWVRDRR